MWNCSGRGYCLDGKCHCVGHFPDPFAHLFLFTGDNCENTQCPYDCNNHGKGFQPLSSSNVIENLHDLTQHTPTYTLWLLSLYIGTCNEFNSCECNAEYTGEFCQEKSCGKDSCNEPNGVCEDGLCQCKEGYKGRHCKDKIQSAPVCTCPDDMKNAECVSGKCVCKSGWIGAKCDMHTCPNDCSNNGACIQNSDKDEPTCSCDSGFSGVDCSVQVCKAEDCLHDGVCKGNECSCTNEYVGPRCERLRSKVR